MTDLDINRRKVLAAIAGTSVATFAGLGYATEDSVRYTHASSHSCDGYTLDAEWRETYTRDGETTLLENTTADPNAGEDTGTEDTTAEPSVINLQNILPGDRGTVSFRLTADRTDTDVSDTVSPTLSLDLTGRAENGINDPEREAGDTSSGDQAGELQDNLQVTVWKDTGLLGFDALGGNNRNLDPGEEIIREENDIDPGVLTLEEVNDNLNDEELGTIDATADESVSVTLRWEFTGDEDINVTQTDSVTFDLNIGCQ